MSGFTPHHSTETTLLRVFNDLILTVDSGDSAILVLLDLTVAFDKANHTILMSPLENFVRLRSTALRWFESNLTDRSFSVHLGEYSSGKAPLTCGVPQGSVLGPVLFSLYMLPLASISEKYNVSFHCFEDDIQIYLPLNQKTASLSLQPLFECLNDVKSWMDSNFLKLNNNKTEVIIVGQSELQHMDNLGPLASYTHSTVKSLGVLFDRAFHFEKQISSVFRGSFFQLGQIAKVKSYLPQKDLERIIHAFIISHLDYFNSLYVGLDKSSNACS